MTPNLAYRRALQGVQSNNQEGEVKKVEEKEGGKASLTPEELVARRHIFTNALTQLVSAVTSPQGLVLSALFTVCISPLVIPSYSRQYSKILAVTTETCSDHWTFLTFI